MQKILTKNGITSSLRPKTDGDCYVLDISSISEVEKIYKYLPNDSIRLERKVNKFKEWYNQSK